MSISAQLLTLPQWGAILLVVAIAVAFSVVGFLVVHRFIPVKVRRIHNDVAGFVFATVGVTYGVLLAFVVIVVWEQYNDARLNVENESSTALVLYHNMAAYPDQAASGTLLEALTRYARSSAGEQSTDGKGQTPSSSPHGMDRLLTVFGTIIPHSEHEQLLYAQIMQNLNDLAKYRHLRHQAALEELPGVIWIGVITGAVITIGFTFLFGTENVWAHITIMSCLAALIAVAIFVVIELDHPSMGAVSIGPPDGYSRILEFARDRP